MDRVTLEIEARTPGKSSAARALRRTGKVPGVLYGQGREAQAFAVDARLLREALGGAGGMYAILDVVAPGSTSAVPVLLKDYQVDPIRDRLVHIDLVEVRMDEVITSQSTLVLVGDPRGVSDGGVLDQPVHTVAVTALPGDLPERVEIDVSELGVGDSLRISDVTPPAGVTLADDPDTVVASVTAPTQLEAVVEDAEAAEAAAGGAAEGVAGGAEEGDES